MKKKVFVWVMALVMVFSSMSIAFADDSGTPKLYPNYRVKIVVNNNDCVHMDKMDVRLQVQVEYTGTELVLKYDENQQAYVDEGFIPVLNDEFGKLAPDVTAKIVVEDGDPNHEVSNSTGMLSAVIFKTKAELKAEADATANFIIYWAYKMASEEPAAVAELEAAFGGTLGIDADDNVTINGKVLGMDDLIALIRTNPDKFDATEENLAMIEEYEEMMASNTFLGQVEFTESIDCNCPDLVDYSLYHEYYDENNQYVAQEWVDSRGADGAVVKVKDVPLQEKYEGVTYKFKGAYIYDETKGGIDRDNPVTEFTVAENIQVVFIYEAVKAPSGGDGDDGTKDDGAKADGDKGADSSVDTGDDFNVLPFIVLMILAVGGSVAVVARRRA